MSVEPLEIVGPDQLDRVVELLGSGGVVAIPTDTVYGLAARLDRPDAIELIGAAKGRPTDLALPVLVASTERLDPLVTAWAHPASTLASAFWPGPMTIVVGTDQSIGHAVGGDGSTIGLRCPAHESLQALLAKTGPLAVTSANAHGAAPCITATEVRDAFGPASSSVSLIVDGGVCDGEPSTVVDCTGAEPVVLRVGPITADAIREALR
jgi:L-threonylcarbamoyladenylate synthase